MSEEDRDAQQLLCYDDIVKRNKEESRFIRVIYGSGLSPFILNTSFQNYVEPFEGKFPEITEALLENTARLPQQVGQIRRGIDKDYGCKCI